MYRAKSKAATRRKVPLNVVVCSSDPLVRRRVTETVEAQGDSVLAETDFAFQAAEVAERYDADCVIIDLHVGVAEGLHPLDDIDRPGRAYFLVILSDRPEDMDTHRPRLAAVGRHDVDGLASAISRLDDDRGPERRRAEAVARARLGPKALASATEFFEALGNAQPGDDLLLAMARDEAQLERLAMVCLDSVRADDYVCARSREIAVLMPLGDVDGAKVVQQRIRDAWGADAELLVRASVIGEESAMDLFTAEVAALRETADAC